METSGNLPMSSAETTSAMTPKVFLALMEFSIPRRIPTTTMVSTSLSDASVVEAACAWAVPLIAANRATEDTAPANKRARDTPRRDSVCIFIAVPPK